MIGRIGIWWQDGHPIFPAKWTHRSNESELTWLGRACNIYYRYTLWARPSWWRYWLGPRDQTAWGSWLATVWCRLKGHPSGEIFYNAGGLEPDHRCKDCGETIN